MSLHDVHAVTGIPLNCLAALEEGDLSQFPSPVYARGYIRSYAEAVRLDGDRLALELWRRIEEAQVAAAGGTTTAPPRGRTRASAATAPPRPTAPPRQRTRPTNGRSSSNLAPLRQPVSPWVPKPGRIRRMAPVLERVAIGMLLVVLAVAIWDLQRTRPVKRPAAPRQAATIAQTHDIAPPTTQAPAPPSASTASTTPVSDNGSLAVYTAGRDQFAVMLQATDAPCWVQVRASQGGPVLFEGTLQPGQSQPFDATRTLWVRLGNLGHANLLVDGESLVLPNKPSVPYNVLLQT
ncbi:MAG: helix-turn-helix domain-containing protein [Acidimicrobiia bacterium]|nr:helix-turn-helix domain-containing protein [Acidimicrobiia bacterium]